MNASQTRLSAAILANLKRGVCTPAVMLAKSSEYRRNAARDLSIAADIVGRGESHAGAADAVKSFQRSAATQLANAVATESAVAEFRGLGYAG